MVEGSDWPRCYFRAGVYDEYLWNWKGRQWSIDLGVILLSGALVLMWKMLLRQATEIERLKRIVGAPTDQAV